MVTLEQLTTQLDKIAACLMRPTLQPKALMHLHEKLEKLDHGIFVTACDQMSLDLEYMPKLKQIYAFYYTAKAAAREENSEWAGCRYCTEGKVFYERQIKGHVGWLPYLGWCRHCNPPFKKDGMFGLYSDRQYQGIRFEHYEPQGGRDLTVTQSASIVKNYTGTEDAGREEERQANKDRIEDQREGEVQQEDIPF